MLSFKFELASFPIHQNYPGKAGEDLKRAVNAAATGDDSKKYVLALDLLQLTNSPHLFATPIKKQTEKQALEILEDIAWRGHVDAMEAVAYMFAQGRGADVDLMKARGWLLEADSRGSNTAKNNLKFLDLNLKNLIEQKAAAVKPSTPSTGPR
jgi:TPR repeat protein